MTSTISKLVFKILCDNDGCLEVRQLNAKLAQSSFGVKLANLGSVLFDDGKIAIREGKQRVSGNNIRPDSLIVAKTSLRLCQRKAGECGQCDSLHLCRYFVCGGCTFGFKCKNPHSLASPHNAELLKRYGLQDLTEKQLYQLLLQNDPFLLPEVCPHYNKGDGPFGSCRFTTSCTKLHVCQHFLQDDCRFGPRCKRTHAVDEQGMKLFKRFSQENIRNLYKIYRNKFIITGQQESPAAAAQMLPDVTFSHQPAPHQPPQINPGTPTKSLSPSKPCSDGERNEICLYNIRKSCSFKEKCARVHWNLPYKWEALDRDGVTWKDLPDMEEIEKAYSDPACNTNCMDPLLSALEMLSFFRSSSNIKQRVDFKTMTYGGLPVRRLSTASSVLHPPHFILTTHWIWYWKEDDGSWIEYGQGGGNTTVTSETLEKMFLADKDAEFTFQAGKHQYAMRFKDAKGTQQMFQQNLKYQTKREIRRRPRFVSAQDVKDLKSGSSHSSSSSTAEHIPLHWDKKAIPDLGYKLVPLSRSDPDYNVEKDFRRTMPCSRIESIQRIQNPSLWKVFQWQKDQMQKRNGGKHVDEKLLFHGTEENLVEAICDQNFDWRMCGVHGTAYGKGSYFARDASYSDRYSKVRGSLNKIMFVARVLVGEYTKGSSSYVRPPPKLESKALYDSCVDSVINPSIFVIFEKQQIYPEYLIKSAVAAVHESLSQTPIEMAPTDVIIRVLCENHGCLDFEQLQELAQSNFGFEVADLRSVLFDDSIIAIREGKQTITSGYLIRPDSLVVAKTSLRICQKKPEECTQCQDLHLCRYLISGSCTFGDKCKNSHSLASHHNNGLLKRYGLQDLTEKQLLQLLLQNDPFLLPEVCAHYNKGDGQFGSCKFTTSCKKLHVCLHFLQGDCKFGCSCKRTHTFDEQALNLFRGFNKENIQNLYKIYKNKFIITGQQEKPTAPPVLPVVKVSPQQPSQKPPQKKSGSPAKSVSPSKPITDAERNEICLFFIRRHCSFKEKCSRVHWHLPYRWQVLDQDGVTWKDLVNMEEVEKAFCDPSCETSCKDQPAPRSVFLWLLNFQSAPKTEPCVDFKTMMYRGSPVRRLSTASSVSKPPHFILTTEWLWYWKENDGKWVEYGQGSGDTSVTSQTLENLYLADRETEIPFQAGKQNYVLHFKDAAGNQQMYQQNLQYQTKREVRRRPRFVSAHDVEEKLKSETSHTSSSSIVENVPSHWDKNALPDLGYKLLVLSKPAADYNMIETLFKRTMPNGNIESIQRIQNPSLWKVFQWQKEQMQKRNGGKPVNQLYLFHGTDETLVDAICEQNFDWRMCGVHGTAYGKGSYFARDASYSDRYSRAGGNHTKNMFVALVLVGEYTAGSSSYVRPPLKAESKALYDSCVNSTSKPSIFVIFEKQQIYPEYLIKYT
ncbi:protein mono-ADP-ribosyltransferase PARP12 [Anableps anableps]